MTASYWLILWLVSAVPASSTMCVPPSHEQVTFGQYTTRAECEAAFTAAYGEGLSDANYKTLHMCVKAGTVMP